MFGLFEGWRRIWLKCCCETASHAAVVRNGHHPERPFQTGIGPVSVRIPKVRSKNDTPVTFRSALVPLYVRRTKTLCVFRSIRPPVMRRRKAAFFSYQV